MRLLVFFDLPVVTKSERRAYAQFRRFLLDDGYDMVQFSVYVRLINGLDGVNKHLARLTTQLPPEGAVRAMVVTEKQFSGIKLLVGAPKIQEKAVTTNQLLLF